MSDNPRENPRETPRDKKEDTGFELDKIDVSKLVIPKAAPDKKEPPKPETETRPQKPAPSRRESPRTSSTEPSGVSSKVKLGVAGFCVLLLATTTLFLVFGKSLDFSVPVFKSDDYTKPETYISVGPVITSMDSGDLIKMTLDINCTRKSNRKKIAEMDSQIRSRVVWALQTPRAQRLMASGDYVSLRIYLSKTVMEIIPQDTVTEIYFSEFLRY